MQQRVFGNLHKSRPPAEKGSHCCLRKGSQLWAHWYLFVFFSLFRLGGKLDYFIIILQPHVISQMPGA